MIEPQSIILALVAIIAVILWLVQIFRYNRLMDKYRIALKDSEGAREKFEAAKRFMPTEQPSLDEQFKIFLAARAQFDSEPAKPASKPGRQLPQVSFPARISGIEAALAEKGNRLKCVQCGGMEWQKGIVQVNKGMAKQKLICAACGNELELSEAIA